MISYSLNDTKTLAYNLAARLKPGDIILLNGELGSGKTQFAKYICEYYNITDATSPTFTILNIYEGSIPIYHFDLYRINNENELYDIGCEEFFYGNGITIIEWGDKLNKLYPENSIKINFKFIDENVREIIIIEKDKL